MKIAVITDHIPSRWAHNINTVKHAQVFHDLGFEVFLLVIQRFTEDFKWKDDILEFLNVNEYLVNYF